MKCVIDYPRVYVWAALILFVASFAYQMRDFGWHHSYSDVYFIEFPNGTESEPLEIPQFRTVSDSSRHIVSDGCALTRIIRVSAFQFLPGSRWTEYCVWPVTESASQSTLKLVPFVEAANKFFAQKEMLAEVSTDFIESRLTSGGCVPCEFYDVTRWDLMAGFTASAATPMQRYIWEKYSFGGPKHPVDVFTLFWPLWPLVVLALMARGRMKAWDFSILAAIPMGLLFAAQHALLWLTLIYNPLTMFWLICFFLLFGALVGRPRFLRRPAFQRAVYAGSGISIVFGQLWLFSLDSPLATSALWGSSIGTAICVLLAICPQGTIRRVRPKSTRAETLD